MQLNIVAGKRQYLFDENGRRYLDGFAGIAVVSCGHGHPDVVQAIIDQVNRVQHSTVLFLNHAITDLAEALAAKMPGNLKVTDYPKKYRTVGVSLTVCMISCNELGNDFSFLVFAGYILYEFRDGSK